MGKHLRVAALALPMLVAQSAGVCQTTTNNIYYLDFGWLLKLELCRLGGGCVILSGISNDPAPYPFPVNSIAFAPDGTLYAAGPQSSPLALMTVDTSTGLVTPMMSITGVPAGVNCGLAFRTDGQLFASCGGSLYSIDRSAGTATLIPMPTGSVGSLAFAPNDVLYSLAGSSLYTLNPGTGLITSVTPLNRERLTGLTFDPSTGTFYSIATNYLFVSYYTARTNFDTKGTVTLVSAFGRLPRQLSVASPLPPHAPSIIPTLSLPALILLGASLAVAATLGAKSASTPRNSYMPAIRKHLSVAALALPVLMAPSAAVCQTAAGTIYYLDMNWQLKNELSRLGGGSVLLSGSSAAAIAFAPDGTLYGCGYNYDGTPFLSTLDTATGVVTPVLPIIGGGGCSLAFRSDGQLFASDRRNLYSIDRATGTAALIPMPRGSVGALAFGRNDVLYSVGDSSTGLYTLDPERGRVTSVIPISAEPYGPVYFSGLTFDFVTETFYATAVFPQPFRLGAIVNIDRSGKARFLLLGTPLPNFYSIAAPLPPRMPAPVPAVSVPVLILTGISLATLALIAAPAKAVRRQTNRRSVRKLLKSC